MAVRKRAAKSKAPQRKNRSKKAEPKKAPIEEEMAAATENKEQKDRELQELSMKIHEEKQREKLLMEDEKSKVSGPAEEDGDIEIEDNGMQAKHRAEIGTTGESGVFLPGGEALALEESEQATEGGEFQAGDHHEGVAQGDDRQYGGSVDREGAVREDILVKEPQVPVIQMIGAVDSVEDTPFGHDVKKEQPDSGPSTSTMGTRQEQDDFEKMRQEEDFMEFTTLYQQQEVAHSGSQDRPNMSYLNFNDLATGISPNIGVSPLPSLQPSPLAQAQVYQSPATLLGGRPTQQVARSGGGPIGSVDPIHQYKRSFDHAPRAPLSPSVRGGRRTPTLRGGRANTSSSGASLTSAMASDPMGPTLHDEKFIIQGIASCFNGMIPPHFKFDTKVMDKMTCKVWQTTMETKPDTFGYVTLLSAQYAVFKLRVLARVNIIPSWWWFREQIVTVLRKEGKWVVEDEWTDQQIKNAVDAQILYEQTAHITKPF